MLNNRIGRHLLCGFAAIVLAGCGNGSALSSTCTTPTPAASMWPAGVVDIDISQGVLIETEVFDDGRETVGRWSIASADLGPTSDALRASLVDQGFALEGSPDSRNLAYGRNGTGQVIDVRASVSDACGRVVITVDSIAATQPDPPA